MPINIQIPDNGSVAHVIITADGETLSFVTRLQLDVGIKQKIVDLTLESPHEVPGLSALRKAHPWLKIQVQGETGGKTQPPSSAKPKPSRRR